MSPSHPPLPSSDFGRLPATSWLCQRTTTQIFLVTLNPFPAKTGFAGAIDTRQSEIPIPGTRLVLSALAAPKSDEGGLVPPWF